MQISDEMVEKAARIIDPNAFSILDGGDKWRIIHSHYDREEAKTKARSALEAALSAAEPVNSRNDEAGYVEFLNEDVPYIVRDIQGSVAILTDLETRKVIGYRVYDPDSVFAAEPSVAVKALQELHAAEHAKLGEMLLDKSEDGKSQANWQGGHVNGINAAISALSAQAQDVAETEAIAALKKAEPYVEICHSLMTQKETRADVWRVLKQVRAAIAAAPAKQEGGE